MICVESGEEYRVMKGIKMKMKKVTAIILVCLLAVSVLASCGEKTGTAAAANGSAQNSPAGDSANPAASSPANQPANSPSAAPSNPPAQDRSEPISSFDADRVIAVFTREDGSGTRDAFVSITGVGEDMYVEAVVISETNEILTKVEETEFAISYVSVGSLNPKVKALSINGVSPSNSTILDGSYALQRPFLVCANADSEKNALVQDFISFIMSAEGQEIVGTKWTKLAGNAPAYSSGGVTGTLKVGGSTSVEPLMQSLRQAYIALNPGVEIEISGGGSGAGISEATSGILDIGMSSRALKDSEKEGLTGYEIALDGVAVIVNPANPLNNLTIEQVKVIFTGEVTRWNQAG